MSHHGIAGAHSGICESQSLPRQPAAVLSEKLKSTPDGVETCWITPWSVGLRIGDSNIHNHRNLPSSSRQG